MRPHLAESSLLAGPDNSCQGLEEPACLPENEGHGAAGVYEQPRQVAAIKSAEI